MNPSLIDGIRIVPAQNSQPGTAHRAAAANTAARINQRRRVLMCFYEQSDRTRGYTDFELHRTLGIVRSGVTRRREEITRVGLLEDSGRERPTDTKSPAIVWVLTEKGIKIAESGENPQKLKELVSPSRKSIGKRYKAVVAEMLDLMADDQQNSTRFVFLQGQSEILLWALGDS